MSRRVVPEGVSFACGEKKAFLGLVTDILKQLEGIWKMYRGKVGLGLGMLSEVEKWGEDSLECGSPEAMGMLGVAG